MATEELTFSLLLTLFWFTVDAVIIAIPATVVYLISDSATYLGILASGWFGGLVFFLMSFVIKSEMKR